MRGVVLLTAVMSLFGCAFGRTGLIRQQAERLVPGCAVDEPGKVDWREIEPWLYKVEACGTDLWCKESGKLSCSTTRMLTLQEFRIEKGAEALRCPVSSVVVTEHIDFAMGDPVKDLWWWGVDEVSGCGRAVWCGERGDARTRLCEFPPDFTTTAAQLAVDTGCPIDQMQPQARQVFEKRLWKAPERGQQAIVTGQSSWRIEACGRAYSCTVTSGAAAAVVCKPALDAAPVSQQP
jgi:hypothetical protein